MKKSPSTDDPSVETTDFPWYDSPWLTKFVRTTHYIQRHYPEQYQSFLDAMEPLRTRPDFTIKEFENLLGEKTLQDARLLIKNLTSQEKEKHEVFSFGRQVIHNHPFFNELQDSLTTRVSDNAGEPVEPHYNFLSLYTNFGSCSVHMDAPEAKWTLDCCIEQSTPWPIHFSQVQPWPVSFGGGPDWQTQIRTDPNNHFSEYALREGDAILFSGSSQWHYRDLIPHTAAKTFCHLVFFHYIPRGMKPLIDPRNWPDIFNIPELAQVVASPDNTP